jgi:hypothetical protein
MYRLDPGTELIVEPFGYRHHGIYVGGDRVIHYAGWISYRRGLVEEIPLAKFGGKYRVRIGRVPAEPRQGADIVNRARSRLGERRYHLLNNNCEHFCNWCQTGESHSAQVETIRIRAEQIGQLVRRMRTWLRGIRSPSEAPVRERGAALVKAS